MTDNIFEGAFGPGAPAQHNLNPRDEGGFPTPWGFLGNLVGGVPDVVSGISGIFSGVGSDIIKLIPGGEPATGLFTPRFLSDLPGALKKDFLNRYDITRPGHVLRELYQQPLSYLFDALAIGDVAFRGASIAAKYAPEFAEASKLIQGILPKERSILIPPEGTSSINPDLRITQLVSKNNPVSRFFVNTVRSKMILPLSRLEEEAGKLQGLREGIGPIPQTPQYNRLKNLNDAIDIAKQAGVDVYQSPFYAKYKAKRAMISLRSHTMADWMYQAGVIQKRNDDIFSQLAAEYEDGNIPDEAIDAFVRQGFFGSGGTHELSRYSEDELATQVQDLNFPDINTAIEAVRSTPGPGIDPRIDAMPWDVHSELDRRGDPKLASYNRIVAHAQLNAALSQLPNISPLMRAKAEAYMDAAAQAAIETYGTTWDDFYNGMQTRFSINEYAKKFQNDNEFLDVTRHMDRNAEVFMAPTESLTHLDSDILDRTDMIDPNQLGRGYHAILDAFDAFQPSESKIVYHSGNLKYVDPKGPVISARMFEDEPGIYRIAWSSVPEHLRGQGVGANIYTAAAEEARRRGGKLRSDVNGSVSPEAQALWRRMEERGLARQITRDEQTAETGTPYSARAGKEWEFLPPADPGFAPINVDEMEFLRHTKVRDERGPIVLTHGSPFAFGEFDLNRANPQSLVGPGIYGTADTSRFPISNDYAGVKRSFHLNEQDAEAWASGVRAQGNMVRVVPGMSEGPQGLMGYWVESLPIQEARTAQYTDWVAANSQAGAEALAADLVKENERVVSVTEDPNEPGVYEVKMEEDIPARNPTNRKFYLDIRNPFMLDQNLSLEARNSLADAMEQIPERNFLKTGVGGTRSVVVRNTRKGIIGQNAYDRLRIIFGGDKTRVNEFLQEAGFDGIEYSGGTRMGRGGVQHRAFVAFNEKQVIPWRPQQAQHIFPTVEDLLRSAMRSKNAAAWYEENRAYFAKLFHGRKVVLPGGRIEVTANQNQMGQFAGIEGVHVVGWHGGKHPKAILDIDPHEISLHELFANFLGVGSIRTDVPRNLRIAMDAVISLAKGQPIEKGLIHQLDAELQKIVPPTYTKAGKQKTLGEYHLKQATDIQLNKMSQIASGFSMDRWPEFMRDENWKIWNFRINNLRKDPLALTADTHFWRRMGFGWFDPKGGKSGKGAWVDSFPDMTDPEVRAYWEPILKLIDDTAREAGWDSREQVQAALWDDQPVWLREQALKFDVAAERLPEGDAKHALQEQARGYREAASSFGATEEFGGGNFTDAIEAPDAAFRLDYMTDAIMQARMREEGPEAGVKFLQQVRDEVRGSIEFGPNFKTLMTFFRTADWGTVVHENAHLLRQSLSPADNALLEKAYGITDGIWEQKHEEMFAEDAVHWDRERSTVRPEVSGPLSRLFEYLGHMWRTFRDQGYNISDEARSVLDRTFGEAFRPAPASGYQRWERPLAIADLSQPAAVMIPAGDPQMMVQAARESFYPNRDRLQAIYGRGYVQGRIKDLERTIIKQNITGMAPNDMNGYRVVLGSWADDEAALARLPEAGFQINGITDTRGKPGPLGDRKLAVSVISPEGVPMEVEFGTPEFARVRDAYTTSEQKIELAGDQLRTVGANLSQLDPADPRNAEAIAMLQNQMRMLEKQIHYGSMGVQAGWEGISDELAVQKLGQTLPGGVRRKVMNEYRTFVYQTATKPLIDAGVFDPAKAFDAAYVPLRMDSGAIWDVSAGPDGNGDFVGGKPADQLHFERMQADLPMPIYFPFYDARRLKVSDFLAGTGVRSGFMRKIKRPTYLRRRTGELYMEDTFVKDPRDALTRRALAALRVKEMGDWYRRILEEFGKPVDSDMDVDTNSEVYTAPMGTLQFFNAHIGLNDQLMAKMAEKLNLSEDDVATIMKDFAPKMQANVMAVTRRGVQGYALPKMVAEMAEQHIIVKGYEDAVRMFWDTPQKMWRALVLTARPAWVVNNVLGSAVFLKMQGGSLMRVLRQMDPAFRQAMSDIIPDELKSQVETGGIFGQESAANMPNIGNAAGRFKKTGQVYDAISNTWRTTKGWKTLHRVGDIIRHANTEIENAYRRESFLTSLEKQGAIEGSKNAITRFFTTTEYLKNIANKGIDIRKGNKALEEANYFHNDYNALGPFERGYIRRYFMPFYSFYKHVLRLAVRYPLDYGLRNEVLTKLAQFDDEMMRDRYGVLPSWLRGAYPLSPVGAPGQDTTFFSASAANPFSMIIPTAQLSFLQMFYPEWKMLAEMTTGRSTLTGRQFTDANVVVPFGTEQQYRIIRDENGNVVDAQPIQSVRPGIGEYLLQQVPMYNLAKGLIAGGRTYDTESLLSVIGNRLSGQSPLAVSAGGEALPASALYSLLSYAGVPLKAFDVSQFQTNLTRGSSDAIRQFISTRSQPALPSGSSAVPPTLRQSNPFEGAFG